MLPRASVRRIPTRPGKIDDMHQTAHVRIRLDIAYDGTAFSGWATQPELRTVQGTLEDALRIIYRELPESRPTLTVAGRTDAGVHATGQVAHLDLPMAEWDATARGNRDDNAADALLRRLTGVLGQDSDVVVTRVTEAPDGFDARFSAIWRSYEYRIADSTIAPNPLERHRTTYLRRELDLDLMNRAAELLIGLHDFAGFCKPRAHATTIRTLQEFHWTRDEQGVFIGQVRADAFCHSMVRSLVGMCSGVGEGRLKLSRVPALLDLQQRSNEFTVLGAKGLTLTAVGYPQEAELAARQEQTRAKRTTPVTLRLVE